MKINTRGIARFFKRNGHIVAAVAGLISTGYTAYQAFKAGDKVSHKWEEAERVKGEPLDIKEKAVIAAKDPDVIKTAVGTALTGGSIIAGAVGAEACIVGAAGVATTYMNKYREYKDAVAQADPKVANKAAQIVAQAHIADDPRPEKQHSVDDVLYYDTLTETEFWGQPGVAIRAQNILRHRLEQMGNFTVADYRDALEIPRDQKLNKLKQDEYQLTGWDQFSFMERHTKDGEIEIHDYFGDGLMIFEEIVYDDNATLERHVLWVSNDPNVNFLDEGSYSFIKSPAGPRE